MGIEPSTYDLCLFIITAADPACFGVVGMQIDDILGLSDRKFADKESEELTFAAKKKTFLNADNPLLFNGCVLTIDGNMLHFRQKRQRQKLEPAVDGKTYVQQYTRGAYIATICQPKASFDLFIAAQIIKPGKEDIAKLNKRID